MTGLDRLVIFILLGIIVAILHYTARVLMAIHDHVHAIDDEVSKDG